MPGTLPPVILELLAKNSEFEAKMAQSEATTKRFGASSESSLARGAAIGKKALLGVAAVAVVVGAGAVKLAMNYETATTLLVTGAGESEKAIGMVRKGMLDMAGSVGTTPEKLAKGMYLIESAGYHGARGLSVLRAAAEGAKVGGADLAVVANGLTTAMTDYNFPATRAAAVTSALVQTVADGKTTMGELSSSLGMVLPKASALGVSLPQVTGALAAMTGAGYSARRASMNLAATIVALGSETAPGAIKALKNIGLTSQQLKDSLGTKGLSGTLQMVTEHVGKKFPAGSVASVAALKTILGGTQGYGTALALTGTHMKAFTDNVKNIGVAMDGSGKHVQGFNLVQKDTQFKVDQAKASLESMGIKLGNFLIPKLAELVVKVKDVVGWFGKHKTTAEALGITVGVVLVSYIGLYIASLVTAAASSVVSFAKMVLGWVGIKTNAATAAAASEAATARIAAASTAVEVAQAKVAVADRAAATAANQSATKQAIAQERVAAAHTAAALAVEEQDAAIIAADRAAGTASSMVLGPIGKVVGIIATVALTAGSAIFGFGDNAHKSIKPTRELTQAILDDNNALGLHTRQLVIDSLQSTGAFDKARKLGIGTKVLTDAVMGNVPALNLVHAAMTKATQAADAQVIKLNALGKASDGSHDKTVRLGEVADSLKGKLGNVTQQLKVNTQAADNEASANDKMTSSMRAAIPAMAAHLVRLGATTRQAGALVTAYQSLPLAKRTAITLDDYASSKIAAVKNALAGMHNQTVYLNLITRNNKIAAGSAGAGVLGQAGGGLVRGPGTSTSDSIPRMLSDGEFVINAAAYARNRALVNSINSGSQGSTVTPLNDSSASRGNSGGGIGALTVEVPLQIDGRTFAKATATFTRDELLRLARGLPNLGLS